jgi:hypothetical protein
MMRSNEATVQTRNGTPGLFLGRHGRPRRSAGPPWAFSSTRRTTTSSQEFPAGRRLREDGLDEGPIGGQADVDKRSADITGASGGHVEHPDRRAAGKVEMSQRETPDRSLPLEKDAGGETEVRDTTPH